MSYRNPKAAPIVTGAAVYEGIDKLTGDALKFLSDERDRKGKLIAESLAAQQAIDDNINKSGIDTDNDEANFETQIYEEAQTAKKAIAAQYEAMSKTFSSPATRAKAKAEIARLNKYPENLAADLTTGKYLTDMYDEALQLQQGETGSISKSNDINLIAVAGDMKDGGKNTKIETNKAGSRILVTTKGGKDYRLNISKITNGLTSNPNQVLFKTVKDDTADIKKYQSALGLDNQSSVDAMIGNGLLVKTAGFDRSGQPMDLYELDDAKANLAISKLSAGLVNIPANYNYANSIWQDRLGNSNTVTEAIAKEGKAKVLDDIQKYYKKKAIANAKNQFGVAIKYTTAKPVKKEEKDTYIKKRNQQLRSLAKQKVGGGFDSIEIGDLDYYVTTKENTQSASFNRFSPGYDKARDEKLNTYVTPKTFTEESVELENDEMGTKIRVTNLNDKEFKLYIEDTSAKKDKAGNYPLVLNYRAWQSSTGDLVPVKLN